MELLDETIKNYDFKKGEDLEKFLEDLNAFIEEKIYSEITKRVNWLLKIVTGIGFELIKTGNIAGGDGNVRFILDSSGDTIIEVNVNGTWTASGWKLKTSQL